MTTLVRRLQRIASTFNARARRFHAPGVVTWQQLATLGERCYHCERADRVTVLTLDQGTWDHLVPFDKGGTNWITNVVRSCVSCQRRKFTKTEDEFLEHRDLEVKCARPSCPNTFKPRFAERQRGMARYCSHRCAGMAKGKAWTAPSSNA